MSAKEEVMNALRHYIKFWQTKNLDSILTLYDDDIVFGYEGEPPNRGKDAVRACIQAALESGQHTTSGDVFQFDLVADNIAFTLNTYDTAAEGGAVKQSAIKDFMVWRKSASGNWLIWRDTMSSSVK